MSLRAMPGQTPTLSVATDAELSAIDTGTLLNGDYLWSDESGGYIYLSTSVAPLSSTVLATWNSDGGTLPGRLVSNGVGPVGPTGAAKSEFIYRPGDPSPVSGVYTSWAALVTDAALYPGDKEIFFNNDLAATNIPTGTWDFGAGVTKFTGSLVFTNSALAPTIVTIADGANILGVRDFEDVEIRTLNTDTATPVFDASADSPASVGVRFRLFGRATITNNGAGPTLGATNATQDTLHVELYDLSSISTAAAPAVALYSASQDLFVDLFDGSSLAADTLSTPGPATLNLWNAGATASSTQTSVGGALTTVNEEEAARVHYLDTAPLLGSTDVQGAIDALKVRSELTELAFADRAAISAYNVTTNSTPNYATAHTTNVLARFRYDSASTLTVDGVNVLSATPSGRWIRIQEPMWEYVNQATYYIDYTSGDDENTGLSSGTALKTNKEWFARTQAYVVNSVTINWIGTTWPGTDKFTYPVQPYTATGNTASLVGNGTQTVVRSGTTTAACTQPVNTAGGESATITDAAVVSWAADIGRLIVIGSSYAWILKDLGGGVARVTPWATSGGGIVAAPGSGLAYNVLTVTDIAFDYDLHSACHFTSINFCQVSSGIRTATARQFWLACKFTNVQVARTTEGIFANCLFQTGALNFSTDVFGGAIWSQTLLFGAGGFLNSTVTFFRGYAEFQSVACQGGGVIVGRVPSGSDPGSPAIFTTGGIYGLGILDAPAGALDVDGASTAYISGSTLGLWGKANATFGTRFRHGARAFVSTSVTPTLASTGTELSFPSNPTPAFTGGAAVPATAACATWAAWAAAPFGRYAQCLTTPIVVDGN